MQYRVWQCTLTDPLAIQAYLNTVYDSGYELLAAIPSGNPAVIIFVFTKLPAASTVSGTAKV